ncbi:MAG: HEAT repeat domain-containing protein [Akkermansiaceae bacterium]|nr:HEAT repeat domain-containing protein [Armatimonadota bacterium]
MPVLLTCALAAAAPLSFLAAPYSSRIAPEEIAPSVPLPAASLSEGEYKSALAALMADSQKRPGVYVSLATLVSRDVTPPHAAAIVEVLAGYIDSTDPLETVVPLKLLGRCGAAARPALPRVLSLASSSFAPVRLAVAEAIGGIYYIPRGTLSTCPPGVTAVLIRLLRSDPDRGTKRAAAVALGRSQSMSQEVLIALAAVVGGSDVPVALGGLSAAQSLGPAAKLLMPAIKTRLADGESVANAILALFAVGSPQETVDAMAQTLSQTNDFVVRQTLVYYAAQLPAGGKDTRALADAIKPLMEVQVSNNGENATAEDVNGLRASAASAYQALSGDTKTTADALAALVRNAKVPLTVRRSAVTQIGKMGKAALDIPEVLPALKVALSDKDSTLQGAAVAVLFKFGGPAAEGVAPRLSELLLAAWKGKEDSRAYSLMNSLYRIGPRAKTSALPVLKKIIAGEPKGSPNAQFAQLVLEKVSE